MHLMYVHIVVCSFMIDIARERRPYESLHTHIKNAYTGAHEARFGSLPPLGTFKSKLRQAHNRHIMMLDGDSALQETRLIVAHCFSLGTREWNGKVPPAGVRLNRGRESTSHTSTAAQVTPS